METKTLETYWSELFERIPGLTAALVTDLDGVAVLSVPKDSDEAGFTPALLTSATQAMEQASKLGMGRNTCLAARFGNSQVVQFGLHPLIVHLIANASANTGLMMDMSGEIRHVLQPLQTALTAPK